MEACFDNSILNLRLEQPTLIITGMHRSGTSLTAAMMQSAGLDIGNILLQADFRNPKGFFENLNFLEFHEKVLFSLGIFQGGWTFQDKITVPEQFIDIARKIVQQNASPTKPWGWKEPRTTLFLEFWKNLLPEANFLFVFRSPWEVIDSLYRRGDEICRYHPEFALKTWILYNQKILDFEEKFPESCLICHINSIALNPNELIEQIGEQFDIKLSCPSQEIYDPTALQSLGFGSHHAVLVKRYFPEAFELYRNLISRSKLSNDSELISFEEADSQYSPTAGLLQDWFELRCAQRELAQEKQVQTQDELTQTQDKLAHTQTELQEAHSQLHQTQDELAHTQTEFREAQQQIAVLESDLQQDSGQDHSRLIDQEAEKKIEILELQLQQNKGVLAYTQSKLLETKSEIECREAELQKIQLELQDLRTSSEQLQTKLQELRSSSEELRAASELQIEQQRTELQEAHERAKCFQERVTAMETSKFWKLRKAWFRVKQISGLPIEE